MDCIFCKIVTKELPSKIVAETEDWLAFRDIQPVSPVHILLVPKRHIATVNDLCEEDERLVGRLILGAADLARREGLENSGFRLVLNCNRDGGQEVFHLHLHLMGGRRLGPMAGK